MYRKSGIWIQIEVDSQNASVSAPHPPNLCTRRVDSFPHFFVLWMQAQLRRGLLCTSNFSSNPIIPLRPPDSFSWCLGLSLLRVATPCSLSSVNSELRWMVGRISLEAMIQVPRGAGLMFILNSGGGVTRCRAAVFSELGRDGGEKSIKGMIQVLRCAELLYILNSCGWKNLQGSCLFWTLVGWWEEINSRQWFRCHKVQGCCLFWTLVGRH